MVGVDGSPASDTATTPTARVVDGAWSRVSCCKDLPNASAWILPDDVTVRTDTAQAYGAVQQMCKSHGEKFHLLVDVADVAGGSSALTDPNRYQCPLTAGAPPRAVICRTLGHGGSASKMKRAPLHAWGPPSSWLVLSRPSTTGASGPSVRGDARGGRRGPSGLGHGPGPGHGPDPLSTA